MKNILISIFVILSTACCGSNVPKPDNAIEDPNELRALIDGRTQKIETLRLKEIVLDYFGEKDRVKVRQLILVKSPTSLRVQTRLPGTDEILSLLVSDGTDFSMHRRDTNEFFSGPATPDNVAKLLPVDLSAADVARVMMAGAPWDRFDEVPGDTTLAWDGKKGYYKLAKKTAEAGEFAIRVRHTDFAIVEMEQTNTKGEQTYRYKAEDWERIDGIAIPQFRRFVWPERDLDFSMDVGETQINVDLIDRLFELSPPPGSRVISL